MVTPEGRYVHPNREELNNLESIKKQAINNHDKALLDNVYEQMRAIFKMHPVQVSVEDWKRMDVENRQRFCLLKIKESTVLGNLLEKQKWEKALESYNKYQKEIEPEKEPVRQEEELDSKEDLYSKLVKVIQERGNLQKPTPEVLKKYSEQAFGIQGYLSASLKSEQELDSIIQRLKKDCPQTDFSERVMIETVKDYYFLRKFSPDKYDKSQMTEKEQKEYTSDTPSNLYSIAKAYAYFDRNNQGNLTLPTIYLYSDLQKEISSRQDARDVVNILSKDKATPRTISSVLAYIENRFPAPIEKVEVKQEKASIIQSYISDVEKRIIRYNILLDDMKRKGYDPDELSSIINELEKISDEIFIASKKGTKEEQAKLEEMRKNIDSRVKSIEKLRRAISSIGRGY